MKSQSRLVIAMIMGGVTLSSVMIPAFTSTSQMALAASRFSDMPNNHWAARAVDEIIAQGIMRGTSATTFSGGRILTRNEMSQIFYNGLKRLERLTGKELRMATQDQPARMSDLDPAVTQVIEEVVNVYGIMSPMPGSGRSKFQGNLSVRRYEVAWTMSNYLKRVEKISKVVRPSAVNSTSFSDLRADFWATPAVRDTVDRYQVMAGYPDRTFRGGQAVTRYEIAAIMSKLGELVERDMLQLRGTPEPSPIPTPVPTPVPIPTPVPTPPPAAKAPFYPVDLQIGGRWGSFNQGANSFWGINGGIDVWGQNLIQNQTLGLYINGDYMDFGSFADKNFNLQFTDQANWMMAGGAKWRLFGNASAEDPSMFIGAGYRHHNLADNSTIPYGAGGPELTAGFELPLGYWLTLYGHDSLSFITNTPANRTHQMAYSNTMEIGVTLPAWTNFALQLAYRGGIYQMDQIDPTSHPAYLAGESGVIVRARLRM